MIFKQSQGPGVWSAIVEDDGRVAYAYLLDEGRIVADVWLYNRAATPEAPEWGDRDTAPFLNPRGFAAQDDFTPPADETEVGIEWWEMDGRHCPWIILSGRRHALLAPGRKPGWCVLAAKDGPLALAWPPQDG